MNRVFSVLALSFLILMIAPAAYADSNEGSDAVEQLRNRELGKDGELGEALKVELGPAHQGENPNVTTNEELPEAGAPTLALVMLALMFSAFGGVLLRKT